MVVLASLCCLLAVVSASPAHLVRRTEDNLDSPLCLVVKSLEVHNAVTRMSYVSKRQRQWNGVRATSGAPGFLVFISNIGTEDGAGRVKLDMKAALVTPQGHCRFVVRAPGNFNGIQLGSKGPCKPKSSGAKTVFSPKAVLLSSVGPTLNADHIERLISFGNNQSNRWDMSFDRTKTCPIFDWVTPPQD